MNKYFDCKDSFVMGDQKLGCWEFIDLLEVLNKYPHYK